MDLEYVVGDYGVEIYVMGMSSGEDSEPESDG